jgi:AraC-like DNA-binding protein
MHATVGAIEGGRLERSCTRDWIRFPARGAGYERAEAFLSEHAFAPHRHDTYAIGLTLSGRQGFRYRGSARVSLAGQLQILHPDETHDGTPLESQGFRYRILYLEPELVRHALADAPLPFVSEPVQDRTAVTEELARLVAETDEEDDLSLTTLATTVADTLTALAGRRGRHAAIDVAAVAHVREYLAAHACEQTEASALERLAGIDRFTIARHFRRAYGTSPDRYRMLRRLELARRSIGRGSAIADVAAETGFADQSHLTRQFKRAYGITPGAWGRLAAAGARLPSRA